MTVNRLVLILVCAMWAGGLCAQGRSLLDATGVFGDLGVTHISYTEELAAPLKSTETGTLPTLRLGLTNHDPDARVYYRGWLTIADGGTQYRGTDQSGTVTMTGTTQNLRASGELNLGVQVHRVTFYTGVGYQYWDRQLGGSAGYSEQYAWLYLPVGVRTRYQTPRLLGVVDLSVRPMLHGDISIDTATMFQYAPLDTTNVTLGNRVGVRLEAPVHFTATPRLTVNLDPWYQYSGIGVSAKKPVTANGTPVVFNDGAGHNFTESIWEPASHTHEVGVVLGVTYAE